MKRSRDNRALKRKSTWGRQVAAGEWAVSEWNALRRCWELGLPVPYPVQIDETVLVAVGEHRNGAELGNRQGGGKRRNGCGQHPVAGPAAHTAQRDLERIQAAGHSHRVLDAPRLSQRGFELCNFLAEDVPSATANTAHRFESVLARIQPLALEIVEQDHGRAFSTFAVGITDLEKTGISRALSAGRIGAKCIPLICMLSSYRIRAAPAHFASQSGPSPVYELESLIARDESLVEADV